MAKKRHTIVRLDKVEATNSLESVVFEEDLDAGVVAQLGELLPDKEGRKGEAPKDLKRNLVFMAPVPMSYEDTMLEEEFFMEAGKLHRGYVLNEGNIVTLTDEAFDEKPAVGDILIPKTGSFGYKKGDTASALKFEVIDDKEYLAGFPATVLRVVA